MHIVLIHGAGGSERTWRNLEPLLVDRGYPFTAVRNPLLSLQGDAACTRAVIDSVQGPVLLVAHSYGGAVMTQVGAHESVAGLVYISAFAPDVGESVDSIVENYETAQSEEFTSVGPDGELVHDRGDRYWDAIGPDVDPAMRQVLAAESRPCAEEVFTQAGGDPAWRYRPSWYLVASDDRNLRPENQRDMAARAGAVTTETATSHFVPEVAPDAILAVIEDALTTLRG